MIRKLEREKDGDRDREIYMERVSDQECGSGSRLVAFNFFERD